MDQLLLSNISPAKFAGTSSFSSFFEKAIGDADKVKIASGYISAEALTELAKLVEVNKGPTVELLIGMHHFEGFTRTQYEAAVNLARKLTELNLGTVKLSTALKFHGKLYSFIKDDAPFASVVGSSNLSSMFDPIQRLYEVDLLLYNSDLTLEIADKISKLTDSLGEDILTWERKPFKEFNPLLENHDNVEKVDENEMQSVLIERNGVHFEIPISTAEQSNLNCFFGKGRVNKRGLEIPRPWYEAELIVPILITNSSAYPSDRSFTVFTDDCWKFECNTSGTNSKNLRSKFDLKILGKWIKGRLEHSGALEPGQYVTQEVLNNYGRNSVSLFGTNDPDIWILDFKV